MNVEPIASLVSTFNSPTMRFHNIIAQTQAQSRSLSGRFGGEERLEDYIHSRTLSVEPSARLIL